MSPLLGFFYAIMWTSHAPTLVDTPLADCLSVGHARVNAEIALYKMGGFWASVPPGSDRHEEPDDKQLARRRAREGVGRVKNTHFMNTSH